MSLELLNTIAAIGTFLVIATTALAAVVQLRHMRASNQLEGLLSVLARVEDANFNTWLTETQRQLPEMLADPQYVQGVIDNTFDRSVAWLQLGNSYDWVGSLVKNRLIPVDAFLDVYSFRVIQAWELMIPIIVLARYPDVEGVWENFEYLYVRAQAWWKSHGGGNYPKHTPRAQLPPAASILPAEVLSRL
ncbi:MAG TPA: hypothetical protein VJP85_07345 [Candidatus Baltobacteraceae bacterium]|nr:hypothetical protein [Candidatus Baltobacteraceae bacterium]